MGMDEKNKKSARYLKSFCARIASAREGAGYTQQEMADALGIKRDAYSKYEFRSLMPHHLIPAFCRLTGFGPWYILTGQPDTGQPQAIPPKKATAPNGKA